MSNNDTNWHLFCFMKRWIWTNLTSTLSLFSLVSFRLSIVPAFVASGWRLQHWAVPFVTSSPVARHNGGGPKLLYPQNATLKREEFVVSTIHPKKFAVCGRVYVYIYDVYMYISNFKYVLYIYCLFINKWLDDLAKFPMNKHLRWVRWFFIGPLGLPHWSRTLPRRCPPRICVSWRRSKHAEANV